MPKANLSLLFSVNLVANRKLRQAKRIVSDKCGTYFYYYRQILRALAMKVLGSALQCQFIHDIYLRHFLYYSCLQFTASYCPILDHATDIGVDRYDMITNILIQSHKSPFGLKLTLIFPESEQSSTLPVHPRFPNFGQISDLFTCCFLKIQSFLFSNSSS